MTDALFRLSNRLALTVPEAADAIGVSERHLREMLPELPHLRMGTRVVIPVEDLKKWLSQQADTEKRNTENLCKEILQELHSK